MSLFKRGDTWWLYIVHNGQRIRKSTETDDRRRAQRIHDEFKAKLWKHKPGGATVHGALDAWVEGKSASDRYKVKWLKQRYADRPLNEVTEKSLYEILPANAGSSNRYINVVQAALHRADISIKIRRKPSPPVRVRWLSADEWRRLDHALPAHLRPLVRFSLATGLRQHNVIHLEWSQVDLQRRVAWVHGDQAKSGRAIGVPLSDAAMTALRGQRGIHERWVFPHNGAPITTLQYWWERSLKKACIENFRWHDLRHTWASWHVMHGTRLEILKELGGWASLNMVLRYAHLSTEHLAEFANNAKPRHVLRHKRKKVA